MKVEDLEDDFVVENVEVSSDGEDFEKEEQLEEFVEEKKTLKRPSSPEKIAHKEKPGFVGNSKRRRLTFNELGIEVNELPALHEKTWSVLLDKSKSNLLIVSI
jgi:hypothetical protein